MTRRKLEDNSRAQLPHTDNKSILFSPFRVGDFGLLSFRIEQPNEDFEALVGWAAGSRDDAIVGAAGPTARRFSVSIAADRSSPPTMAANFQPGAS